MRVTDTQSFGTTLKCARKRQKLTQRDITEMTGISSSFISDLENGKETVELGKAILLANMLGLDIDISHRG